MIGRKLVARLLAQGELPDSSGVVHQIDSLVVCDVAAPEPGFPEDERLEVLIGDFGADEMLERLVGEETGVIFHIMGTLEVIVVVVRGSSVTVDTCVD